MTDIKKASLDDIEQMKAKGKLRHYPDAPTGVENLGADFWAKAKVSHPKPTPHSVHLKVAPDVFEFFKRQGKGHLTKMQDVLKAYVDAHLQP